MPAPKPPDDEGVAHPDRVGRFVLLLPIASGGMGTVYLARTRGIGGFERDVALKLSHPNLRTPEFTVALLDEAVLAGGIRHPNVVSVLDVGEDPHGLYIVMEYVEGDSLAGLARRARQVGTPLSPSVVLRLMDDALIGLHAAHEMVDANGRNVGLVHRDFSPQNIMIGVDGLAKLTDFGVAKALGRLSETTSGAIKGKVGYMSPEQARGDALDRRVDVWAAGVVVWELLAGRRLYKPLPDAVALLKIVSERPPRLRFVQPEIPEALDEVVGRALEPDLDKRFRDADSFARALASAAGKSVGLADRRDVADVVRNLLEPALVARRHKVKRIVELKEQMGLLTRLPGGRGTPSGADTPSFESPPILPERAVISSPAREDVTETDSIGVASTRRARASVAGGRRSRSARVALSLGLVAGSLLLAVGFALFFASEPVRLLEHAGWRKIPTVKESAPSLSASPMPSRTLELRVKADAPVQEILVDGIAHTIDPPKKTFTLSIVHDKRAPLRLEALSAEGAKTRLTLAPDSSLALLKFPAIAKDPPGARPNLLPSPYPR